MRTARRRFAAATAVLMGTLAASPLLAAPVSDLSVPSPEIAQAYQDLPGVAPQEPLNSASRIVCEQVIVERKWGVNPTRGPRYETLNTCSRDGGPVFSSPQLPPSLEREKRGLNY